VCVGCRYVTWINHQNISRFIEAIINTVSEVSVHSYSGYRKKKEYRNIVLTMLYH
jgi:hypothetical protein